jgi:hypothetical protein
VSPSEVAREGRPAGALATALEGHAVVGLEIGNVVGVARLCQFDIVYSWGVLHHTGAMWSAFENVTRMVRDGSLLFIAIYNDQGPWTTFWKWVKRTYNRSAIGRWIVLGVFCSVFAVQGLVADLARLKNPLRRYPEYKRSRGMSRVHNWVDWVGGWPFEVATPEQIFRFGAERGFHLENLVLCGAGHGCNEFVFSRTRTAVARPA